MSCCYRSEQGLIISLSHKLTPDILVLFLHAILAHSEEMSSLAGRLYHLTPDHLKGTGPKRPHATKVARTR